MMRYKTFLVTSFSAILLATAAPVYAQGTTISTRQPDPVSLVVMAVGLGGLLMMGLVIVGRGRGSDKR